ncbi:hypothetical protein VTK26DRAFT_8786 [Humicola hyalothermophila]
MELCVLPEIAKQNGLRYCKSWDQRLGLHRRYFLSLQVVIARSPTWCPRVGSGNTTLGCTRGRLTTARYDVSWPGSRGREQRNGKRTLRRRARIWGSQAEPRLKWSRKSTENLGRGVPLRSSGHGTWEPPVPASWQWPWPAERPINTYPLVTARKPPTL